MEGWIEMRMLALVAIVGLTVGSAAMAAQMSFDDYWNQATHSPGAVTKQYPQATVVTDEKNLTVFIFTKPNNPAHPGGDRTKTRKRQQRRIF